MVCACVCDIMAEELGWKAHKCEHTECEKDY